MRTTDGELEVRPKFGCFVFANIVSFFLGFIIISLGVIAYLNAHRTKQDQLNDFDSELGNFDPSIAKSRIEFIGDAGSSIGTASNILQMDPKSVMGYEALIGSLNALGATAEAKHQYKIATSKGVKLPPFSSNVFQYTKPPGN